MKIITFFIGTILLIATSFIHTKAEGYQVLDSNVTITSKRHTSFQVEVEGMYNFSYFAETTDQTRYINEVVTDGEHFILYGYIHDRHAETYYDAYLLVFSKTGEIISEQILNLGALEEFDAYFLLEAQPIFRVRHSIDENQHYVFVKDVFLAFDETYQTYQRVETQKETKAMTVIDDILHIRSEYKGTYHMAIDKDFNIYRDDVIYGIVDGGVYDGEANIFTINGIVFDGVFYPNHVKITYPGHYVIEYHDTEYTFTVNALIEGVHQDMITVDPVVIQVNEGHVYLNDDLFISETEVMNVGHHVLVVEGLNGYEQVLTFTITSGLEGVYDHNTYQSPRTLDFDGVGYLNNRLIHSGHTVSESGIYTLHIQGLNDYKETHHFEIDIEPVQSTSSKRILQVIEIILIGGAVILGGLAFMKLRKP